MKHLDMTGQPCPIPVVRARRALQAGETSVLVTVDNGVAVQNLRKMADGEGYAFASEPMDGGLFQVTIGIGEHVPAGAAAPGGPQPGYTILIARERLGDGDPELGAMLMKGFLFAQTELPEPPSDVIFLNGGAKLTTQGAASVPDLLALESKGTRIWTCGACANFYGITERLAVGKITDMMRIARMLQGAEKLVTL